MAPPKRLKDQNDFLIVLVDFPVTPAADPVKPAVDFWSREIARDIYMIAPEHSLHGSGGQPS